ncbi:MFS transporter [Caedibacter taeniospiralis]|jgi:DHA1 family bicyclomycin/chloramphenicol resistance-like MFS transporter|uniref:MFS transporter n=1 Tax=Caedibacter taeniospiralis TaxID=28907 RepID=UPI0037C18A09
MTIALTQSRKTGIIWLLLLLSPLIGMAIDEIAPALPSMTEQLHSNKTLMQNLIAFFLLGYGVGNFISGFLTDAFGRRKLMLASLTTALLFCLLPALISNVSLMLFARFIQGIAFGSVAVIIRASMADLLDPQELVKMGSLMGAMWGLGPIIGPIIGGYLQVYFGWQACFYFLAIATAVLLFLYFVYVPETQIKRSPLKVANITTNIVTIAKDKQFIAISILMGLAYSLIVGFQTVAPFLIEEVMGYSVLHFSYIAFILGIVFVLSTFINRKLIDRVEFNRLMGINITIAIIAVALALLLGLLLKNPIYVLTGLSATMFYVCGAIFPLSMGKGISMFRLIAGTAAAIMFLVNMSITSLNSFILSMIHLSHAQQLTYMYLTIVILIAIIYGLFIRTAKSTI